MMDLTAEQHRIVDAFDQLYAGKRRRLTVGGYAGTGKSVVVSAIVEAHRNHSIAVCAPTGKAAHVLRTKGIADACTFHSLVYRPAGEDDDGRPRFRQSGEPLPRCVIVDEASMLSRQMVRDLEKRVRYVMYVGDHGQLEPIGEDAGLMAKLDYRLETIHRQATGSPIIAFAHHVRQGGEPTTFGMDARVQEWTSDLRDFDAIIVGFNRTRMQVNKWMRKARGYSGSLPQVGEQIICLRNHKDYEVWNGMTATVKVIDADARRMTVDTDDGPRENIRFDPEQFGQEKTKPYVKPDGKQIEPTLWDFGYAVTCHKFQGSQAPRVAVVDEGECDLWATERWRYTAATRAAEQLRWVTK